MQPEVDRLGDIVLDLRNVEEAAITRGDSERLEPEKQGQGVLTLVCTVCESQGVLTLVYTVRERASETNNI